MGRNATWETHGTAWTSSSSLQGKPGVAGLPLPAILLLFMAPLGKHWIWGSGWFAAVKTGGLLGIGTVGIAHPGSSVGITTRTAVIPPVFSIARGIAVQLIERARQGDKSCLRCILASPGPGAPHWVLGSAILPPALLVISVSIGRGDGGVGGWEHAAACQGG